VEVISVMAARAAAWSTRAGSGIGDEGGDGDVVDGAGLAAWQRGAAWIWVTASSVNRPAPMSPRRRGFLHQVHVQSCL
jgi:hypothetical protein